MTGMPFVPAGLLGSSSASLDGCVGGTESVSWVMGAKCPQVQLWVAGRDTVNTSQTARLANCSQHSLEEQENIGKVTRHAGITVCATEAEHHTLCLDTLHLLPENLALIFLYHNCVKERTCTLRHIVRYIRSNAWTHQCCVYVSPSLWNWVHVLVTYICVKRQHAGRELQPTCVGVVVLSIC